MFLLLVWTLIGMCGGCSSAHYPVNAPLAEQSKESNAYALRNLDRGDNSDSLLVVLALSGGGYRAAAMAHAVMQTMSETPIEWENRTTSLLDEVDVISSVSGGSLAAAYYALNPDGFLANFPRDVLALDLQGLLLQRILSPLGLWRQTSDTYGRGDLLQEVLDENVFHGKRFADIARQRPMVHINATEMRYGKRFEFTQDQFDHLCSDLDAVPVSRAVAASMAVPVLLSPITVWNHQANCIVSPRMRPVSGDAAFSRYVHLVDGGLADNTGISAVVDGVAAYGGLKQIERASRLQNVRKRVIVLVNAQVVPFETGADTPQTPGLFRQLRSLVNVPIDRQADARVQSLVEAVRLWRAELREGSGQVQAGGADDFYVIELNLSRADNPELAARLQRVPTSLRIEPSHLADIRRFVHEALANDAEWLRLRRDLQRRSAPPIRTSADVSKASPALSMSSNESDHVPW